jgi:Glycoside hydrolase family 44
VAVTPEESTHPYAENLIVTATVKGVRARPTGSVTLSSGSYRSPAAQLNAGEATFYVAPGSLAKGADTLTVNYQPDSNSAASYSAATGGATMTITSPGNSSVHVTIDTLANRHEISPYIYGINTMTPADITNLAPGFVRFGGNQASDYNWKAFTYNSGGDWYFEDFTLRNGDGVAADSVALTRFAAKAGSAMLTTMPTLGWVAKESGHWSYSVKKFGPQCKVNPNNADGGNGQKPDCKTRVTTEPVTEAYYPLVDTHSDCATGNCLYRDEWAKALSAAFGPGACNVPYSAITSCHFYDMDNEPEIWDGSHGDVHPIHPGYTELSSLFEKEGIALKSWDPSAVRFGPITCCWNFLWSTGSGGDDKIAHGGIDYVPWWLNEIYWLDQIKGARTLDVFDVHSYVGPNVNTSAFSNAEKRAAEGMVYRTYWDPTYYNADIDADWITNTQPRRGVTFLIPRLKALVNAIYPGTPLSFSEWESFLVAEGEWDFSTALSDADAFGVMGREGLSFSTRWGGPSATDETSKQPHPNYQGMKLYTAYDGARHGFGTLSVSDRADVNPDLFASYAALDAQGATMTVVVLNKDPNNAANVTFDLHGFQAAAYKAYTVASTDPGEITASASAPWKGTQSFAPYTITLLVVSGSQPAKPASEWYLNPDDLMIPALGTGILNPKIMRGTARVTLTSAVFDAFEGAKACDGTLAISDPVITAAKPAAITVSPASTPGFCHYTVTASDGVSEQTQGGWIVVGRRAARLVVQSGNNQTGKEGKVLKEPLTVALTSVPSGFSSTGSGILFTASAGTLSNGKESGSKVIAQTDSSGNAAVTLTLPSSKEAVTVTAQDMFALGGRTVTFTETVH